MLILLKLHRSIGHGLKTCMWFGYDPENRFCHFFPQFELSLFSGINTINICRVWINPPINFTFSDNSVFLKKNLGREHKFLKIYSRFIQDFFSRFYYRLKLQLEYKSKLFK